MRVVGLKPTIKMFLHFKYYDHELFEEKYRLCYFFFFFDFLHRVTRLDKCLQCAFLVRRDILCFQMYCVLFSAVKTQFKCFIPATKIWWELWVILLRHGKSKDCGCDRYLNLFSISIFYTFVSIFTISWMSFSTFFLQQFLTPFSMSVFHRVNVIHVTFRVTFVILVKAQLQQSMM